MILHFWYRLTEVVLEKRPLNGCSSVGPYVTDSADEKIIIFAQFVKVAKFLFQLTDL